SVRGYLVRREPVCLLALRLRSRAVTASFAISLFRLSESFNARALPPKLPSATAAGFFFPFILALAQNNSALQPLGSKHRLGSLGAHWLCQRRPKVVIARFDTPLPIRNRM